MSNYSYRGIYDEGEVDRIKSFLSDQREMLVNEENKQSTTAIKLEKYAVPIIGLAVIIITLKLFKKWKK